MFFDHVGNLKPHKNMFRAYKDDAGSYPTTTTSSGGLYGSSTTNAGGTTYSPTSFEKGLVGSAQGGITSNYNNLMNGIYDSPDFNKYKSDLRQQQANAFENTVVNPLISRGLLGTTGAKNLASMYGNTMAQQDSALMDNYRNQLLQNLNTSAQMYSMPYDMMQGTSGLSQSLANNVSNYNLANAQMKAAQNAAMYQAIGSTIGGLGSMAGGFGGNAGTGAARSGGL
jgi:hypothetical protein